MKSIVTGGCGFIGSHIVDALCNLDHTIDVIDDLSAPENEKFYFHSNKEKVSYHQLDISKDDCSDIFKNVDFVFHLAARSRIQPTIGSPGECFEVNVVGTQRILEWSRMHSAKRLIYSGTSSLYGHQNTIPFQPNMPTDCLNPYSMSKWMGEQVCKLYSQIYNVPSIVLRYFNVYGPREPVKGHYAPVVGLFKRQVKNGMPITIVGDGNQKRDFTYIDDVVQSNICAMNLPSTFSKFEIYNVGTGKNHTINDVAQLVSSSAKKINIDARPAEVRETLADIQKTINDLGWQPKFNLEDKILSY